VAIAKSFEWDKDNVRSLSPIWVALFSALPCNSMYGGKPLWRLISISFQPIPFVPVPRAFIAASLAANLLAICGALPLQYANSIFVNMRL